MIKHLHGLSIKVKYILLLSTKKNKNKTSLINVQFDSEANDFEQLVKPTFFFFFVSIFWVFKTEFLCVVLTVLELTLWTRLASNPDLTETNIALNSQNFLLQAG